MELEQIGAFVGAFCGALIATPFWLRKLMKQIKQLQSCAHCHMNCKTVKPVVFENGGENVSSIG